MVAADWPRGLPVQAIPPGLPWDMLGSEVFSLFSADFPLFFFFQGIRTGLKRSWGGSRGEEGVHSWLPVPVH